MRILIVHNLYRQPSGEDVVVGLETDLLRQHGHEVETYVVSNQDLEIRTPSEALRRGLETIWSAKSYRAVAHAIASFRPDLVHVHNFFPQLSPAVYWAAKRSGKAVVQTLHNYRLVCANALLLRDEHPCELCVGAVPLPALRYKCYRNSTLATVPLALLQVTHRVLPTWKQKVDGYIALTAFAKDLFVKGGLPADRVHVKPNFTPDPLKGEPLAQRQKQFVYVGRITPEKGVDRLLQAWERAALPGWRLLIVGDGIQCHDLQIRYAGASGIVWAGWLDRPEVLKALAQSSFMVQASKWYEGLPMTVVESLAMGTPVIAPARGPFREMIRPDENGLLFDPELPGSLTEALERGAALGEERWHALQAGARSSYLSRYTSKSNYEKLMEIYELAIQRNQALSKQLN